MELKDVYDPDAMRKDYVEFCATLGEDDKLTPLRLFRAGYAFGIQAAIDHDKPLIISNVRR